MHEELSILRGRKFPGAEERKRRQQQFWASRAAIGYVLAGGASSRFGRDKALVEFEGKALIARVLETLKGSGANNVRIVGPKTTYGRFGVRCVKDEWPGEGPLGGIITALWSTAPIKSGYRWNVILSCDMPFLTGDWLAYMIERAKASEAEVVVPKSEHGLEPLCACWRTSTVEILQNVFLGGVRKVTEAMKHLRMEVLDETHWKRFDSAGRLFWNMNTPQDYEEAVRVWGNNKA